MRVAIRSLLLPMGLALVVTACGGSTAALDSNSQIDFGVDMAKRGLWSEALFRFQQAERLEPGNFRVYNNLAVAYEANGRFDEALETYQKALRMQPENRELRRNYSRFIEFYQSYKTPESGDQAEPAAAPPPEGGADGG